MSHRAVDKRRATGEMLNRFTVSESRFVQLTKLNNEQTDELNMKVNE